LVIDLPIHQKIDEVNRAHGHMTWLQENFPNIERQSIDLTQTFETLKSSLPEVQNPE
jgi:NAD+ synthase